MPVLTRSSPPLTRRLRCVAAALTGLTIVGTTSVYATWEQLPELMTWRHRLCTDTERLVGVVFTGNPDRVDEGIRILDRGQVKTLLISGNDYQSPKLSSRPDASVAIFFDDQAANTKENSLNTAKWLASQKLKVCAVELVTSAAHMARSVHLLQKTLKAEKLDIDIRPHPLYDSSSYFSLKIVEMGKMLLTLFGIEERNKSAYLRRPGLPLLPSP